MHISSPIHRLCGHSIKKKTKETKQQSCMYLGLACLPVTIHVFELILNDIKNSVNDLSMYKNE